MKKLALFFKEDPFYKLLALLIAVALWAYVGADKNPKEEALFNASVEAVNVPAGYNLNMPKNQLSVAIRAPRSTLLKIRPDSVRLWVDLKGVPVEKLVNGETVKVNYSVEEVNPKKIKVTLSPSAIRVSLSRMNNIYMPVNILYSSAPPVGYLYKSKMISDNTVSVNCSDDEIGRLASVKGFVPAVSEKGFSGKVSLRAYTKDDKLLKNVVITPSSVTVTVLLEEEIIRKIIELEPQVTGKPQAGYVLKNVLVRPERLRFEGPLLLLNDISVVKTESVSVSGASENVKKKVKALAPAGIAAPGNEEVEIICVIEKKE